MVNRPSRKIKRGSQMADDNPLSEKQTGRERPTAPLRRKAPAPTPLPKVSSADHTARSSSADSSLVLGWQVTLAGDPVYWLDPAVRPGGQRNDDLVTVAPADMASHTVIIAQSGSGKSTF